MGSSSEGSVLVMCGINKKNVKMLAQWHVRRRDGELFGCRFFNYLENMFTKSMAFMSYITYMKYNTNVLFSSVISQETN